MTQAAEVRAWARQNGWEVASKGRLHPDIWSAFSQAHGGLERDAPIAGATGRCNCGRQWAGLREAHCTLCHRHFSTPANFDAHRPSSKKNPRGACVDPETIEKPYLMRIKETVWGPMWIKDAEHFMTGNHDGLYDEE